MSFFSKLRDRLTRSSSKIGAGLDDIVAEGSGSDVPMSEAPAPAPELAANASRFRQAVPP